MFRPFRSLAMLVAAVLLAPAYAQTEFVVSTGSCNKDNCGTYVSMFRELKNVCSDVGLKIQEQQSAGSIQNVDRLVGNEVNAALVQSDVLFWRRRTEDLTNVKTLVALHPEEVHFVALVNSATKAGGVMGIGAKPVVFSTVDQLAGYKVGAVDGSGSFVTARLIRGEGGVNYEVQPFADESAMKAALAAGQIQAVVYVGGANLAPVAAYGKDYKLLVFSDALQSKLKEFYAPATLNYSGLTNSQGIRTIATQALLVTRTYRTPRMVDALSAFRRCADAAIPELKETRGTHKKWQAVREGDSGKWSYYELPASAAATPAPAPKRK